MDYTSIKNRLNSLAERKGLHKTAIQGLRILANLIRPVYAPVLVDCDLDSLDRTKSFLFGLPWTSEEYPWPLEDDDPRGDPLGPLLQLDLDETGILTGEDLGSGLLQVYYPVTYCTWYGRDGVGMDALLRKIPKAAVTQASRLTLPPFSTQSAIALYETLGEPQPISETHDSYDSANQALSFFDIQCDLEMCGFNSDGESLSPAQQITGWREVTPQAYIDLANMTDEEILACLVEPYKSPTEYELPYLGALLGEWPATKLFPYPCLFGWPPTYGGQDRAVSEEAMPLFVFKGPQANSGDWVEVFPDHAIWCRGV